MIALESQRFQTGYVAKKEATQSVAVSEDEKQLLEVVAVANGMRPATAARHLLFRGLAAYLKDKQIRTLTFDEDILRDLRKLIREDPFHSRAAELVTAEVDRKRKQAVGKPSPTKLPVYTARTEGTGAKQKAKKIK
jgi:hypothetical protein